MSVFFQTYLLRQRVADLRDEVALTAAQADQFKARLAERLLFKERRGNGGGACSALASPPPR